MKCYLCDKDAPDGDPPLCEGCRAERMEASAALAAPIVAAFERELATAVEAADEWARTHTRPCGHPLKPWREKCGYCITPADIAHSKAAKTPEFTGAGLGTALEQLKAAEDDMAARTCRTCGYLDCGGVCGRWRAQREEEAECRPVAVTTEHGPGEVYVIPRLSVEAQRIVDELFSGPTEPRKHAGAEWVRWSIDEATAHEPQREEEAGEARRQFVEDNAAACARCGAIATVIGEGDSFLTIGCLVGRYGHFSTTSDLGDGDLVSTIRRWNDWMAAERHRRANRGK